MSDRLAEIKARYHTLMTSGTTLYKPDMAWLIAEAERATKLLQLRDQQLDGDYMLAKVERLKVSQNIMANVEIDHCKTIERLEATLKRYQTEHTYGDSARAEGMEQAAKIAEDEPEPEMEVPPELAQWTKADIARVAVQVTKKNIIAAIRAEIKAPGK